MLPICLISYIPGQKLRAPLTSSVFVKLHQFTLTLNLTYNSVLLSHTALRFLNNFLMNIFKISWSFWALLFFKSHLCCITCILSNRIRFQQLYINVTSQNVPGIGVTDPIPGKIKRELHSRGELGSQSQCNKKINHVPSDFLNSEMCVQVIFWSRSLRKPFSSPAAHKVSK